MKALKSAKYAEQRIAHRIWQGLKSIPAKEVSLILIRELAKVAVEAKKDMQIKIKKDGVYITFHKEF